MAKSKNQKKQLVDVYKDVLAKSHALYLFSGSLKASHTNNLKKNSIGTANITLLKNTLFNIAAKEAGLEYQSTGYNNMMFLEDNIIENAAFLSKFASENEFTINAVVVGKTTYEGSKLKQIASLGSATQVYGGLVGIMSTPTTMLVRSLQSPMQKLAFVISQIQK